MTENRPDGITEGTSTPGPTAEYAEHLVAAEEVLGHSLHQPVDLSSSSGLEAHADGNGEAVNDEDEPSKSSANQLEHLPSRPDSAIRTEKHEEMIIIGIRATDVALGLGRLPAGFYAVVLYSGSEWRTENKCSFTNDDVVEWNGAIPIPLVDLLVTVRLQVYASFEFQPTLGVGQQLREFTITAGQLMNHSELGVPLTLFPEDNGDVVYPCSSISVSVKWGKYEGNELSVSRASHDSDPEFQLERDLENVTNQGHSMLSRFRKHDEMRDLEHSIELFESALGICPLDHPFHAAAQSNLAMAQFLRCQTESANASLEIPLSLYRNALAARPAAHLDRPSTLIQLTAIHFAQFEKQRDGLDRTRGEELLNEVMGLTSSGSHENQAAAYLLHVHIGRRVGPVQADEVRTSEEQGLVSRFTVKDLQMISTQVLQCFEESGDLTDLQCAITALGELAKSILLWDDGHRDVLMNLGIALSYRFDRFGDLNDLKDATLKLRKAVELTPRGHPDKPSYLANFGIALGVRFEHLREHTDMIAAISALSDAVDLMPQDHPTKHSRLCSLGKLYLTRYQHSGNVNDLELAIAKLTYSTDLTPRSQPHDPALLYNLASGLLIRFWRLGELCDLEDAISRHRAAIDLSPPDRPPDPTCLHGLGMALHARFHRLGEQADLDEATSTLTNAVDLTPDGHPDIPGRLIGLGSTSITRFKHFGELSNINAAVSILRYAVEVTPHSHPYRASCLYELGNSFVIRFERLGDLSDLEDAILMLKDAIELAPHGHPDTPNHLDCLGRAFGHQEISMLLNQLS